MSDKIKRLYEERAKAWSAVQDIRQRLEQDGYDLTTEDQETWNRGLDDVERIDGEIRSEERSARLERVEASTDARDARPSGNPTGGDDAAYTRAFGNFLRRGISGVRGEDRDLLEANFEELRAQGAGTDGAGGYTVPEGFRNKMVETMKAYGGLLGLVDVITTTSGNNLPWPTNDDSANEGAILGENSQITEQDMTFGQGSLKAHTYTSKLVRVSLQLMQDSAFNLDTWLPARLGVRIGRAIAGHVATGAGTTEPEGVTGFATGVTLPTGNTTSVTYDGLLDLEHSVDPAYRERARYALSDGGLKAIRKLKDSQNRPLWVPSLAVGVPSTINGFGYTVDNKLPAPAASAKSIAFGDFQAGYVARVVSGAQVMRLSERYADFLQVGFFGFQRFDGIRQDAAAVRVLVHSAT
jgi:HK97 family phage major capsid protein